MPVYNFSTTPLYVAEGQTVQFRYEAPPTFDTLEQIEIRIGELTVFWVIETTKEDFEPEGFNLQDINPAEIDAVYTYAETQEGPDADPFGGGSVFDPLRAGEEVITVEGLSDTTQAPLSISSNVQNQSEWAWRVRNWNGTSYDPWPAFQTGDNWPTATQFVSNQDQIQVRLKASSAAGDEKRVTVTVGTGEEAWRITTGALPVNEPNPVPVFNPLNDLELDVQIYSNVVQILGLTTTANIQIDGGGELRVSNSNATTPNDDGYDVLNTGTAWASTSTVSNGQYVQLRGQSAGTQFTDKIFSIDIGDGIGIAAWNTRTGEGIDTTPDNFVFTDLSDIIPGTTNIVSDIKTVSGLSPDITVPVVIREIETSDQTISNPRIRINGGSSGTFSNVTVGNGDTIQLVVDADPDVSVAPTTESVSLAINVGNRPIQAWSVVNWFGPDTTPTFTQPNNLQNQVPGAFSVLGPIGLTDFNLDIQVSASTPLSYTNAGVATGEDLGTVLISVNGDAPVAGPRNVPPDNTGDPVFITFFYQQPGDANADPVLGLSDYTEFDITFGDAPTFTFRSFNYAVKPVPPSYQGVWYSNKNEFFDEAAFEAAGSPAANAASYYRSPKHDGYSFGTIIAVTKESINGYGDLEKRFPGFLECDGQELNAADYPFLFDAIGTQYGGNGNYDVGTNTYTGTFNLPDYRNKRLAGTGIVDGNRGSSAFLEATNSGGSFEIPGSTGGYWYVSDVGVAGPDPLEQVITTPGSTTGTSSPFFNLGTPKTFGTEELSADVSFLVTGSVNAVIGPVSDKAVIVPSHEHLVLTGQPEDTSGDPVIPWNSRAYYGTADSGAQGPSPEGPDEPSDSRVRSYWQSLGPLNYSTFDQELGDTDGSSLDDYLPLGPDDATTNATFGNYWGSPIGPLQNLNPTNAYFRVGAGNLTDAAVVDSRETSVRVDQYVSIFGTLTHSHLLGEDIVGDPNLDYSYGNANGFGGQREGLPNFSNVHTLQFNTSNDPAAGADLAIELNDATFSWNNATRPIPTVALDPQRKVPVVAPFHKIKYIIKAY